MQGTSSTFQGVSDSVRQASPRTRVILGMIGIVATILVVWWIVGLLTPAPVKKNPPAPVRVAQAAKSTTDMVSATTGPLRSWLSQT